MTSNERVVVIGSGLAGVRLARRLDELGTPVTLIGEEEHPPYNRVLLAEVLAGRYGPEVIALPAPAGPTRARATGIDRAARTVVCADGAVIGYDRLVLATGSHPVLPPLRGLFTAGHELPGGVHAFRTGNGGDVAREHPLRTLEGVTRKEGEGVNCLCPAGLLLNRRRGWSGPPAIPVVE